MGAICVSSKLNPGSRSRGSLRYESVCDEPHPLCLVRTRYSVLEDVRSSRSAESTSEVASNGSGISIGGSMCGIFGDGNETTSEEVVRLA